VRSLISPAHCVVLGASGGIGGALVAALAREPAVASLDAFARSAYRPPFPGVRCHPLDLDDDASLDAMAATLRGGPPLDLAIVATGVLHDERGLAPEKSWRQLERAALRRAFEVNAIGPALAAKRLLPLLRRDRKAVLAVLSARVGSIEDNRLGGWYGYRASKAALNQLVRTFAIELARRAPEAVCVGLHPGTVDTRLSSPFRSGVPEAKLQTPDDAAAHLLQVLDGLTGADSGRLFAWNGEPIPF
jgi:NAD(P)-dependent dehydrogenase (short-subunit alcohol dehydrogenase family)